MKPNTSNEVVDRVVERRRAVALANHYREVERLSIAQIAERLGRSPATVKAYFYDPTGEKARAVKARYVGVCRGCGAYTQPRNGKGDAYAYCKACHPGAIECRWTRDRVLDAMRAWQARYGRWPSSYDWVAHARATTWGRGAQATQRRRVAPRERRDRRVRELESGTGRGGADGHGRRSAAAITGSPVVTRTRISDALAGWDLSSAPREPSVIRADERVWEARHGV
jgi:AcrR family transcriptional regulator